MRRLPRGAPDVAELALVAQLQPHAALDARGDVDLEILAIVGDSPGAPAAGAGVGDPDPLAAAGRAGGRDLEEPARLDDLALPAAVVAGRGDGPLACPRPVAFAAEFLPVDVDRLGRAPGGLDQVDLQLHQQVGARPRAAPAVAEEVAEEAAAEDVAEGRHDVVGRAEVVERRARPARRGRSGRIAAASPWSERTSYASAASLNRFSASASPGFRSG